MDSILRFEKITVEYRNIPVLSDFSLDVPQGEFVSLIGPNGSGKTTLINTILNTVPLKSGRIILNGKDNKEYGAKERARLAAVVPQSFSASFGFSVRDIVMMGRNPYLRRMQSETPEDYRIVDEALKMTDTFRLKDRKISEISGGERQRVVISAALAQQPKLLILDEPTNHLDLHHTLEIMQIIRDLNISEKLTVFAVLHDINMAARYSDKIVIINRGEIVRFGSPQEVLTEEVLSPVYQIDMVVRKNRFTDSIEIMPIRKHDKGSSNLSSRRIHVVCGGGSGEPFLEELRNTGFSVSCGVLNASDSDAELCRSLGINLIEEQPYSPISEEKHQLNMDEMKECDIIILSDVAIGSGNLKNLEAIEFAAQSGSADIYIISNKNRDYVDGKADKIIAELAAGSNAAELSLPELLARIKNNQI